MTSTVFVDQVTPVPASWLNDVNLATYTASSVPSLTALTSVNGGQLAGLRNRIINGGMQVAQRGSVTFTSSNNLYGGCDRMFHTIAGTTVSALALQTLTGYPNTATGFCSQIGNVLTTGATIVQWSQRIESLNTASLNGKTVTFSGRVFQGSGTTQTLTIGIEKANAVDNFGAKTSLGTSTLSVPNSTWVSFSYTIAIGSADASNGLQVEIAFLSLPAQATTQFYTGDWQLEIGSVATPFEQRPYGMELALCQRYYQWIPPLSGKWQGSNTVFSGAGAFPVAMRANPTVTLTGSPLCNEFAVANRTITSISANSMFFNGGYMDLTTTAAGASNSGAVHAAAFNAGNNLAASAEL